MIFLGKLCFTHNPATLLKLRSASLVRHVLQSSSPGKCPSWVPNPLQRTIVFRDKTAGQWSSWLRFCFARPLRTNARRKGQLLWKCQLGITALALAKVTSGRFWASCEAAERTSRVSVVEMKDKNKPEPEFNWKRFWSLLVPHMGYFVVAIVCALIVAVINIQIPKLLGELVNVVSHHTSGMPQNFLDEMRGPGLRLVYMYAAQAVFTFSYIYTLSCAGERVAAQMRKDLFSSILKQDIAFFDHQRTGELVNRLTADVQDFKSAFKMCVSQGLRSIIQAGGCFVSLYFISPQMTAAMLLVLPTVLLSGTLLGSILRKLSRRAQEQVSKSTSVSEEAISNIRTVRAFAMEDKELEMYSQEVDESCWLSEVLGFGIGMFQGGTNLFLNGIVLGTLYVGGHLISTQEVNPGQLMSFLVASQMIQRSLAQLFLLFGQYVRGLGSGARVFEFMDHDSTIPVKGGKMIPYHSLRGDVQFSNVTFAYPTRPDQNVLKNFNLRLPPGRMVAVVGSSGSGKSTVACLLERFYEAEKGGVFIDGVNIRDLDPSWLRGRAVGFINQEPVLFATTIMENIRYGRPNASDAEVIEAAKQANADEFISSFPRGYDTILGERGVTVSGGQKQRIAIARALLKDPSILILDEATSALDMESERIVQGALDKCTKGRTVLVIAHRLSTIQNADIIAVMYNGRIVEMGKHEDLKKLGGLYWNLVRQQEQEYSLLDKIRGIGDR